MSRKFYAVDRETGERWKPVNQDWCIDKQFLVMYDSGYLAVVTDYGYDGISIAPLDTKKWKKVMQNA